MSKKERKTPKTNQEYILSTDAEAILYGLILLLISLIGLLNYGVVGEALTYIFSYLFGIFFVFVYLLLIFFGLYLMIKKSMFKLKIDLKILGSILLVLGLCIASSMSSNLTINNFFAAYQNQVNMSEEHIFAMQNTAVIYNNLGGGIIGYFLTGALNSSISVDGTVIVVLVFIILGMILLFKDLFIRFVKSIIRLIKNRRLLRQQVNHEEKKETAIVSKKEEKVEAEVEDIENSDIFSFDDVVGSNRILPSQIIKTNLENEEIKKEKIDEIREEVKQEEIKQEVKEEIVDNNEFNDDDFDDFEEFEEIHVNNEEIKINTPVNNVNNSSLNSINTPLKKEDNNSVKKEKIITPVYIYPPIALLKDRFNADETERKVRLANERLNKINEVFSDLGIGASAISYTIGPSVTRFDVKVNSNVKTNVLCSIENDLAVRLGGNKTVRLETIVEGKDTSGIEIGNEISDIVSFKECMIKLEANKKDRLLFPLGKDISGDVLSCCLDDMPHLLVCGTTGSGKSVFVHNIICSLIMRNKPDELKLMLIDPKRIEFTKYHELPHLLCPVITSTDQGKIALVRLVEEMERRYRLFEEKGEGASNYKEYEETCIERGYEKLPYIVMICDEFADFMTSGDKEIGKLIQRIAQMARACGIYMVIATQRPSVKVITGEIKANIPSRIALSVSSGMDSRIIIDEPGAENLLGKGDLLARIPKYKSLVRVQSAYIDSKEIYAVCQHIRQYGGEVRYDPNFTDLTPKVTSTFDGNINSNNTPYKDYHSDEKYEEIKRYVIATGKCSTTKLQNTFGIGFSRADGILDTLEADGIIRKEGNRRVLNDDYSSGDDD